MGAALLAGPLIGGAAGGLFGGAAGLIQGFAQKRSAAKLRYAIRRGMTFGEEAAARQTAGVLTSQEYQGGANWLRGLFDLGGYGQDQALSDLKFAAGKTYAGFDPQGGQYGSGQRGIQLREEMARRSMDQGGPVGGAALGGAGGSAFDPIAQQFSKSLAAAQTSRGLYSSHAAASAEASGLAALKTQMQMQALPMLFQLAQNPTQLFNQFSQQTVGSQVFRQTGGKAVFGQATQAAFGGNPFASAAAGGAAGFGAGAGLGIQAQKYIG